MGYIQPLLCLVVAVVANADYQGPSGYRRPQTSYGTPAPWYGPPNRGPGDGYRGDEKPKSYQFGYAVRDYASGNDFGRHETSDGDTVQGQYRVQLPDGRIQIVTYTADWQNGFQADVKYEGEAFYPDKNNYNNNNNNNYNYNNNNYNNDYNGYQNNNHGGNSVGNSGYRDYNHEPYRKSGSSFGHDSYSNSGSSYSKGSSHGQHYRK